METSRGAARLLFAIACVQAWQTPGAAAVPVRGLGMHGKPRALRAPRGQASEAAAAGVGAGKVLLAACRAIKKKDRDTACNTLVTRARESRGGQRGSSKGAAPPVTTTTAPSPAVATRTAPSPPTAAAGRNPAQTSGTDKVRLAECRRAKKGRKRDRSNACRELIEQISTGKGKGGKRAGGAAPTAEAPAARVPNDVTAGHAGGTAGAPAQGAGKMLLANCRKLQRKNRGTACSEAIARARAANGSKGGKGGKGGKGVGTTGGHNDTAVPLAPDPQTIRSGCLEQLPAARRGLRVLEDTHNPACDAPNRGAGAPQTPTAAPPPLVGLGSTVGRGTVETLDASPIVAGRKTQTRRD